MKVRTPEASCSLRSSRSGSSWGARPRCRSTGPHGRPLAAALRDGPKHPARVGPSSPRSRTSTRHDTAQLTPARAATRRARLPPVSELLRYDRYTSTTALPRQVVCRADPPSASPRGSAGPPPAAVGVDRQRAGSCRRHCPAPRQGGGTVAIARGKNAAPSGCVRPRQCSVRSPPCQPAPRRT